MMFPSFPPQPEEVLNVFCNLCLRGGVFNHPKSVTGFARGGLSPEESDLKRETGRFVSGPRGRET